MILIVDDKQENLIALRKTLELHQLVVDTAQSGEEALKKVLKNRYYLIILDVQMPGMDGFEVAEAITGYSKTADIPVIFLSAVNISKQFIARGYAAGGRDYLVKPFDPDILILKVRTFIKLYEQTYKLTNTQQALLEEIEQRKAAEAKKDEFISIASHELNTPLTSVKGYLQLAELAIEKDQKENTIKFLDRTKNQLNKLSQLVAELLDASKIASGKLDYNYTSFCFENFIENTIDVIKQTHPDIKIIRQGHAPVGIYGDQGRMEQVLLNYLTNAIKYAPESDTVMVTVEQISDSEVKVSVKDNGIGISAEKQEKLFEKFYRVEETSTKFQGLGMGLYICAEIIKRHNGKYGVISKPGEGSTFYFSIPIMPQNSSRSTHNQ